MLTTSRHSAVIAICRKNTVTLWDTSPIAIRRMMRLGDNVVQSYDLSNFRLIASVGEPLNAEAAWWANKTLGAAIEIPKSKY
eukprot:scaffold374_cov160-Amphora_coffeaeformis.AAC.14